MNNNNLPEISALSAVMKECMERAGSLLQEGFGRKFSITSKDGRHNLVTEYDHKSEKLIVGTIKEHFPNHSFLGEEGGAEGSQEGDTVRWIIDPIDGTVNFAHNIPIFSISIAAEYRGELLCGGIYAPMMNELFTAERGSGAFLNGQPIHVSTTEKLSESVLVTGFPYNVGTNPEHCIEHFAGFLRLGLPIRRLGSAALDMAYLAAGRFDGYWEVRLKPWDVAAGILILQEAGGTITNYKGEQYHYDGTLLATNGIIHKEMSAAIASFSA